MARLMFSNENQQNNNNDQPSSIKVDDKKSSDVVIMTADDGKTIERAAVAVAEKKYAGEYAIHNQLSHHQHHLASTDPAYKATKILVSESVVARLASKFDGVVVSENNSGAATGTSAAAAVVACKENSFLSSPKETSPAEKAITVRNSSVQKTIKFFEEDLLTNRTSSETMKIERALSKRSSSSSQLTEIEDADGSAEDTGSATPIEKLKSIVQSKVEIESAGESAELTENRNPTEKHKPAVHPKPESLLQKISTEKKSRSESSSPENVESAVPSKGKNEKLYHAPKVCSKKEENLLVLKDKRLSIAKDFSLESVLNDDLENKLARVERDKDIEDGEKCPVSTILCDNKISNNSFLHKYLEQCWENNKSTTVEVEEEKEEEGSLHENDLYVRKLAEQNSAAPQPSENLKNSSALHSTLIKTLNDLQKAKSNDHYEDLSYTRGVIFCDAIRENVDSGNDHYQYLDLEENALSNVYTDVIYAQLNNHDDIENYETISSESYENSPTTPKNVFSRSDGNLVHSGSDSSLEQTNSLYGLKPASDLSSTTTSVFSFSNDCLHDRQLDNRHVYATDLRSTSSEVTDDEEDADYCDSDNDCLAYRKRSNSNKSKNFKKKRKLKFPIYRKEYPQVIPDYESNEVFIDDFDDSSSDMESFEMNGQEQPASQSNKTSISSITQSQNIYGFVEKARKTVRKSLSSLNQIRKMSVGNITAKSQDPSHNGTKSMSVGDFNLKNVQSAGNGGSVRWTSFKSKLKPKYSTVSPSTSVFYLPPEELMFKNSCRSTRSNENVSRKQNGTSKNRRRTTCIELRPTARPTSPPPPPPVDKTKINGTNSVSTLSIYSDPSTRSSNSGSEINSELNSSRSSDLHLRFADEPLYQFYAESIAQLSTTDSSILTDSDGYEEIASTTSRPSAMELITPSPNGHGQHRSLWCEVPEVKNSGILDTLSPDKKRLQEAIFEIITSEASYYKSLSVLDKIFANSPSFKNESILSKNDWKVLFGNVTAVRKCSEKLLAALEKCWQDSILLTGLCDVMYEHALINFQIYVKYCSNQIYIDRTLKKLKEHNSKFVEIINQLEANPSCQSLNLPSFLMLPMQRITRMPLLIDAVLSKMDPIIDGDEYKTYQLALATLNKIVRDCNESARKLERYEEMLLLSQQLEFTRKDVKMYTIASSSRWLIRSGPMEYINPPDTKLTLTKKLTKQTTKLYFFLFNDILIVAKKKNDTPTYVVLDYCARNVVQMNLLDDSGVVVPALSSSNHRYLLMLIILDNHEGKTVEMILNCDSDSTRQRWLEATSSHLTSDNPDEKLYEKWDCPQVSAIHSYTAIQPDELSLHAGDVVKVLKKTTDGWYHGERIRDGMTGWFPGNYTVEIASQHTRAKNLKLRHRLLTLSASYLQNQQQKKS